MRIYIPTMGRVGKQAPLGQLSSHWLERTWLVVPPEERDAHRYDRVLVCPERGIARTRQWIIDHAEDPYIYMVDDDVRFNRWDAERRSLRTCKGAQLDVGLGQLERWLFDGVVMVGFGMRLHADVHVGSSFRECGRLCDNYGFRVQDFRRLGIRFDRVEVLEDIDVTLQLLTRGFPNRISNWFSVGSGERSARGGCSTYRDAAMQARAAQFLVEQFPAFVKLTPRDTWDQMGNRIDVVVGWRKAYGARKGHPGFCQPTLLPGP